MFVVFVVVCVGVVVVLSSCRVCCGVYCVVVVVLLSVVGLCVVCLESSCKVV